MTNVYLEGAVHGNSALSQASIDFMIIFRWIKYRDPTGHVKFTFKLENAGKKAVELNVGKYTKISESVPLLNLKGNNAHN
jgi:hypothetical protein